MECLWCKVEMSPLYLPVQTHSITYGVGSILEKVEVGIENPYDASRPKIYSGNLYVCPECGSIRMKLPKQILDDKVTQGMTIKQLKEYHRKQEEEL